DPHNALPEAEPEERCLVTARLDHVRDRDHGERRTRAEACRGQSGGEAAAVWKPFQRVTVGGPGNRAGTDAADDGAEIEHRQRICDGIECPGEADEHAAGAYHDPRAEPIDEVALEWH